MAFVYAARGGHDQIFQALSSASFSKLKAWDPEKKQFEEFARPIFSIHWEENEENSDGNEGAEGKSWNTVTICTAVRSQFTHISVLLSLLLV